MKTIFTVLIVSATVSILPRWNVISAQEPLDFQGSFIYSPVLTHGGSGTWEELTIFLPYSFIHEGTFYLFYSGLDNNWISAIGMATSADGLIYTKYAGNPVLTTSSSGFDSYNVTQGIVIEGQNEWIMYYNGREIPGYGPGPSVGRATAPDPTGPWSRMDTPVLTTGSPGEWDCEYISPTNVFSLDTGGFIMFFYAGIEFNSGMSIGMATSVDGLVWNKYNDPSTILPPYADSDPVLKPGDPGDWDENRVWLSSALKKPWGYEMYYTADNLSGDDAIGYASSPDGITWTKFTDNPVYTLGDDPYGSGMGYSLLEQPAIVIKDSIAYMYYDYGIPYPGEFGVAMADVPVSINDKNLTIDDLRVTVNPNPVNQSAAFSYTLKYPAQVIIRVFDGFGQMVSEPLNACQTKGKQKVVWNAENLPAGIYFYRIQAGKEVGGGKIVKW